MQYAPTRVRAKFDGFHISASGYAKNAPRFRPKPSARIVSRRMLLRPYTGTCKIWRVLDPNPCRRTFQGVCNTPLHGYVKNLSGFTFPHTDTPKTHLILDPNRRRRVFRGVCNTPLHEYVKNLLGFIFPHTGTPKTHPILGANPCRRIFRGVCNTPLHGYVQNLTGFTFPHLNTPKTHPISPFPIGICPKRTRFQTQTIVDGHFRAYAIRPYTGT